MVSPAFLAHGRSGCQKRRAADDEDDLPALLMVGVRESVGCSESCIGCEAL